MIGTVFLWMFWPSFNSALCGDPGREYAIINTYLALSAGCCATFIFSMLFNPKKRITMEHVQNATLAAGVAMGSAADMTVQPIGALLIGFTAGLLSVVGYAYIKVSIIFPYHVLINGLNLACTCRENSTPRHMRRQQPSWHAGYFCSGCFYHYVCSNT